MRSFYVETPNYQAPTFRHLLVNGSTSGLSFYHANPEHAAGEAEMEVSNSQHVRIYGLKSERNFCLVWIRDSHDVLLTGFGGTASAFLLNHTWTHGTPGYQPGYSNWTPSLFRVERSTGIRLANLWGDGRVDGGNVKSFSGEGTDPRFWSMVVWGSNAEPNTPNRTQPLDRPVLFKLDLEAQAQEE